MTDKWNAKQKMGKTGLLFAALVMASLFSASIFDLYIHAAHAGHGHDAHAVASMELDKPGSGGHGTDGDPPDGHQNDDTDSRNDVSHGCFVFMTPAPASGLPTLSPASRNPRSEPFLISHLRTQLDRPPNSVS